MEKINITSRNLMRTYRIKQKNVQDYVVSNYKLNETIGHGGFAKVKKAYHIPTGQTVAVKIYSKSQLSTDLIKRVLDEIEIQKQLQHQGIAKIYEVAIKKDNIYIFMEYIPNGQLFDYINKKGPIKIQQALKIFCQLLLTLNYLHQKGICHRDIKAQNILLDEQLNPKIIDFGLSKKFTGYQRLNTHCGSPSYVSPQIVLKRSYQPQKVDIWSMGVVLYALLTAQLPFEEEQKSDLITQIINKNYEIKPQFSLQIKNIFHQIFQYQDQRITLKQLMQFQCIKKQMKNIKKNKITTTINQNVISNVAQKLNVDPIFVRNSIISNKYDYISSMYYLTAKNYSKNQESRLSSSNLVKHDIKSKSVSTKTKQSGSQPSSQNIHRRLKKLSKQKKQIANITSLGLSVDITKKIHEHSQKPISSRQNRKDLSTSVGKNKHVSIFKRLYSKNTQTKFMQNFYL